MDRLLRGAWLAARERHRFPGLSAPGLGELSPGEVMSAASGATTLSNSFFGDRENASALIGPALDHALAHHTLCPYDAAGFAMLAHHAEEVLGHGRAALRVADLFVDAVADHYLFFRLGSPVHLIYRQSPGCRLFRALLSGYQRSFGEEFGVEDLGELSLRLSRLPYLERDRWPVTIRRFSRLMGPLVMDSLGEDFQPPLGRHRASSWHEAEVSRSLARLARCAEGPGAFRSRAKGLAAGTGGQSRGAIGAQDGTAKDGDHLYYMKLAAGYNLAVRPGLFPGTEEPYPAALAKWEAGSSCLDVDPWKSLGKLIPGLSQMWRHSNARLVGPRVRVPDLFIMLDSSGSMPDPAETRSWAVLACGLAADAYLKNNARVAVYNFSNAKGLSREILDLTRNRTEVFCALCRYFGGGTTVNLDEIRDILDRKESIDVFLMTDMEILNLGGLIRLFADGGARVCAVHLGLRKGAETFKAMTRSMDHITVFGVEGHRDLPNIVLGQARRFIGDSLALRGD